jgi:hypothetical protein
MPLDFICDSGLSKAIGQYQELNLVFVPSGAAGVNGQIVPLQSAQASAGNRAYLMVAGSTDAASAKLSAAQVSALIAKATGITAGMIPELAPQASEIALAATGLKTFLDEIVGPVADGSVSIAFAIGGIPVKEIISCEFLQIPVGSASGTLAPISTSRNSAVFLNNPVSALGSGNKLIKDDGSTLVSLATDKVIFSNRLNYIAGSFVVGESTALVLAATDTIVLKVRAIV